MTTSRSRVLTTTVVTAVLLLASLSAEVWSSEVTVGDSNWYNNNKPIQQESIQFTDKLRQQSNNNQQQQQQLQSSTNSQKCELEIKSCLPILVQQQVNASNHNYFFNRPWDEFKSGFSGSNGNYWIGNELLHRLTKDGRYKVRFDLQSQSTGVWYFAEYNPFIVFSESTQYESLVGVYTGNAGDAFSFHSNRKFSTGDRDNDGWRHINCAARYGGGFWYGGNEHTNQGCAQCFINSIIGRTSGFFWSDLPGGSLLRTSRMWLLCR